MYRYQEGEIDCQVRFLPCTIQELQLDRAPFLKAVAETLRKLQVNYVLTAERISVLAAHLLAMPGCHFFHSLGNIKRIQGMHPAYLNSVLRRETAAVSLSWKNWTWSVKGLRFVRIVRRRRANASSGALLMLALDNPAP
jgi:hypothetical protein